MVDALLELAPAAFYLLVAANLIVALATFVQFTTGIGYAMIAMPLLALLDLTLVPGPALFTMLFLSLFMAFNGREHIHWPGFSPLLIGLLTGTALGTFALATLNPTYFGIVFGALVLIAIVLGHFGLRPAANTTTFATGGFCSGFMGTLSGIHGPVLAIVFHRLNGTAIRATIAAVFVCASTLSLLSLSTQGFFGFDGIKKSLSLFPGLLIGIAMAFLGLKKISVSSAKIGMTTVATLSALLLIANSIIGLH